MKVLALVKKLCINFCPYYKPSKSNELNCRGFSVIERLIKGGRKITFQKSGKALDTTTKEVLVQNMCSTCPFYERECDFIQHGEDFLPCGGFTLLGYLLELKVITINDIISNIN